MRIKVGDLRAAIKDLDDSLPIYFWSDTIDDANVIINNFKVGNILDIGNTDEETYCGEALFVCGEISQELVASFKELK